jgi:hypothetical protein
MITYRFTAGLGLVLKYMLEKGKCMIEFQIPVCAVQHRTDTFTWGLGWRSG